MILYGDLIMVKIVDKRNIYVTAVLDDEDEEYIRINIRTGCRWYTLVDSKLHVLNESDMAPLELAYQEYLIECREKFNEPQQSELTYGDEDTA